jgi:hypothetical protein
LIHEHPHRPIETGIGIGGDKERAERRIAEEEEGRGKKRDAGIGGKLRTISSKNLTPLSAMSFFMRAMVSGME